MNYTDYLMARFNHNQMNNIMFGLPVQYGFTQNPFNNNPLPMAGRTNCSIFQLDLATKEEVENINYENVIKDKNNEKGELSPLEDFIRGIFSLDTIRELAANGKEELTAEDAKKFIEQTMGEDGNCETLTLEDFEILMNKAGIDLGKVLEFLSNEQQPQKTDNAKFQYTGESETTPSPEFAQPNPTVATTTNLPHFQYQKSAPITASAKPFISSNRSYNVKAPVEKTLNNMSLSELKTEKTKRQSTLESKQAAVNAIFNGENEKIKAAINAKATAKEEYENAIKNDKGAKKFAKKIAKNLKKIEENQEKINKNEIAINNKQAEISQTENTITFTQNELDSLEKALASLPSPSGKKEDKQRDKQLKEKKNNLTKQIAAKKKELNNQKSQLKKLQKELKNLEKDKKDLENDKKSLEAEKQQLDNMVEKYCSELTQAKLKAYNDAVKNLDNVKAGELSTAKKALSESQKAVKEVNEKIIQKQNAAATSSDVVEQAVALAESQVGVRENGSSNDSIDVRKYKNGSKDSNPWCASFVSWLYGAGQGSSNNNTFGYTASSQEIKRKAQNAGCYASKTSGYTPKKGDLAMWTKPDGVHGHVGIVSEVYPDGSFDTIEGNSSNSVKKHHYASVNSVGSTFNGFVQMDKWVA